MIPRTQPKEVIDNLTGERNSFTIKANGKAFRTLIDKLYENKVRAIVRELCTNALDSHIAAGKGDVPFQLFLPTSLDPTFRVRDYGVSMSHEDVMVLYTTIFESTKETTNEQTGQLGLGSKSPFAYTNTFSVTAYKDGERRTYIAHIADDGVPQITLLDREPSDEPTGIDVSIAVKREDHRTFADEAQFVLLGFDTKPEIVGAALRFPEPILEGPGWKLYPNSLPIAGQQAVRMGCVLYPISQTMPNRYFDHKLVVEVPMGSCEVTSSRESLSMDPQTTEVVRSAFDKIDVAARLVEKIENECTTTLEAVKAFGPLSQLVMHRGIMFKGRKLHTFVELPERYFAGRFFTWASHKNESRATLQTPWNELDKLMVVVADGSKVVRSKIRLAHYRKNVAYRHSVRFLDDPTGKLLPRLVRLLGLRPDQVINLRSLPDVQAPNSRRGPGSAPSIPRPKAEVGPKDYYELRRTGGKVLTVRGWYSPDNGAAQWRRLERQILGIDDDKVRLVSVTEFQAEKMGLDPEREVSAATMAALMDPKIIRWAGFRRVIERKYVHNDTLRELFWKAAEMSEDDYSYEVYVVVQYYTGVAEASAEAEIVWESLAKRFPMLYSPTQEQQRAYIDSILAAEKIIATAKNQKGNK